MRPTRSPGSRRASRPRGRARAAASGGRGRGGSRRQSGRGSGRVAGAPRGRPAPAGASIRASARSQAARLGRDRLALGEQRAAERLEPRRLVAAAGAVGEVARHQQAHALGRAPPPHSPRSSRWARARSSSSATCERLGADATRQRRGRITRPPRKVNGDPAILSRALPAPAVRRARDPGARPRPRAAPLAARPATLAGFALRADADALRVALVARRAAGSPASCADPPPAARARLDFALGGHRVRRRGAGRRTPRPTSSPARPRRVPWPGAPCPEERRARFAEALAEVMGHFGRRAGGGGGGGCCTASASARSPARAGRRSRDAGGARRRARRRRRRADRARVLLRPLLRHGGAPPAPSPLRRRHVGGDRPRGLHQRRRDHGAALRSARRDRAPDRAVPRRAATRGATRGPGASRPWPGAAT